MGFEIVWTKKAVQTFGKRIVYLETHWTEKEIFYFTARVNEYLKLLQSQPTMYRKSARLKHTRTLV
jgi:hypothetical protein